MSLGETRFSDFLEQVAAKTPTPGGGAVASAVGAIAAALAGMVVSYSLGKKSLAAHQDALAQAAATLSKARTVMLQLAEEDAASYRVVNELMKLPETDARRRVEWDSAVAAAVQAPMAVAAAATDLLRHFVALAPITNRMLRSDLAIAAVLAEATVRAALWNVEINASLLADRAETMNRARRLVESGRELLGRVEEVCGQEGTTGGGQGGSVGGV
jgi:formiminotetrahydrofolate cyclodeaminase